MNKRKRYRYILCGDVSYGDPISNFRLISNRNYAISGCIRVEIPDDMVLEKFKYDSYSTTRDQRTLRELGAEAMINTYNGWIIVPGLLDRCKPCGWFQYLPREEGYIYNWGIYITPKRYKKPKVLYFQHDVYDLTDYCFNHPINEVNLFFFDEKSFLDIEDVRKPVAIRVELPPMVNLIERKGYAFKGKRYNVDLFDYLRIFKLSTIVRTENELVDVTNEFGITDRIYKFTHNGWVEVTKVLNEVNHTDVYLNPPVKI